MLRTEDLQLTIASQFILKFFSDTMDGIAPFSKCVGSPKKIMQDPSNYSASPYYNNHKRDIQCL